MRRSLFVFAIALVMLGAPAVLPPALASPDPTSVYVESISYGGSGCPQGSVGNSISDDRLRFTLIFDQFVASSGPGVPVTESRKNCQINMNLHLPAADMHKLTIELVYRGYVAAPEGVSVMVGSTAFFGGDEIESDARTFEGPIAQDYLFKHKIMIKKIPAPESCRAVVPMNINAEVRLTGRLDQSAQVTTDSIDGTVDSMEKNPARQC